MGYNKYQSTPELLNLDNYPDEIKELFFDFINTVPYIKNLISENRPYAKDCPRDKDGKIIVDFTNPPIIEDTDYFRPTAIHFLKYGCITKLRPNKNPNSEYGKWVREEIRRCFYGYVRESDGAWITGDMYFFLNYCPIMKVKRIKGKKGLRVVDFPDFLEGQWLRFMYIQHARDNAKHGSELASRGKGKSFSMAAIAAKRFLLGELDETTGEPTKGVETFISSYFKTYLNDDGVLNKFEKYIDFCAEYTQFPKKRLTSSLDKMKWTSGYKESNSEIKKGSGNEVIGISVKDSPGKLRGKRGAFIGLEEMGCHIKGTEVLMYDTSIKKVEDILVGDILMGDDGTPRKVLETYNGIDLLYKVILSNGDWHIVNSNHPIYYKKYSWDSKISLYKLATPIELLNKNMQGCYIPKATINFPYKEVSINPYLLGLWLGDGDSSRISISNKDLEILEWLKNNYIGYIRDLKQSSACKVFHFPSKENKDLYSAFKKYSLFNNKHIPTDYTYNSLEIGLQLLAGLIDTDGNLSIKKHGLCFEITLHESRKHILDTAKFIATNCGLRGTISKRIATGKGVGNIHYRLRISGDIYRIPTKIKRKQASLVSCKYKLRRCWTDYTFKVEPYDIGEYYGFTITDNHLFVLKDSTITHNSFPNLIELYSTLRPSMEDGDIVFGMIYAQGCVCAGTKVFDKYGNLINIEDANSSIMGYNGINASVEEITYLQPETYKECVEIVTTNGSLKCSIDHPLLTLNKNIFNKNTGTCSFYKANELKQEDVLLMHGNDKFGDIHVKDAYLLGALFGDGNYSDNSCVSLSITTEEEYEYYNKNYNINISKLQNTANGGLYAQIYFRGLHPLLKTYNMDKQSFENKKLPNNIWQWDKSSIADFLAGYFDADGNILIVKTKHRSIKLTCKYKNTLELISILLLKLGIYSYILEENKSERVLYSTVNNKEYKVKPNKVYVLYICNGRDIINFRENIHLKIVSKRERLDSYVLQNSKGYYSTLKFKYRKENGKGKYFIDKDLLGLKGTKIISINNIGVLRIYNLTANTTHTYLSNGFISSNTAGDKDSDFSAALKIMYSPRAFNMQPIKNIYDKVGLGKPEFVYFYPAYINRNGCYNKDGISDVTKAILEVLINRYNVKYNTTDSTLITKTIAEHPIVPQEAVLRTRGNLFPSALINERLNLIDANPNIFDDVYVGELIFDKAGLVKYVPSDDVPIRVYPTEDNKERGAIEFYEMPQKNREGKVFPNRYIIGHDPVDDDVSQTMSLTSTFVFDLLTDRIVAEYTGRLEYADDNFEIVRKLCIFYNAKCMYELNKKGIYSYFKRKGCLTLLAETPEYLKELNIIKEIGYGNKGVGVNATANVNGFADRLTKEWLIKKLTVLIKEDGLEKEIELPNLFTVKNRAFLLEAAAYNPTANFDRIRAFGMVMIYREAFLILYQGDTNKAINEDIDINAPENDDFFQLNFDCRFL